MTTKIEPPFGGAVPAGTEFLPVDHAKNPNRFRELVTRGRTVHIRLDYEAGAVVGKVRSLGGGALDKVELEGGIEIRFRDVAAMWVERRPCRHVKISQCTDVSRSGLYICTDDDRPDCHQLFTVEARA